MNFLRGKSMSGIGDALKSLASGIVKLSTLAVKASQPQGNAAQLNASAVSSMAQSATTPSQQEALFKNFAAPAAIDIYNQLPSDQQQAMVSAFAHQLQSPGGAAAALNVGRSMGNASAQSYFNQHASPAQVDLYNQLPPDQQRMLQASAVMSAYGVSSSFGGANSSYSVNAATPGGIQSATTAYFNANAPSALVDMRNQLPTNQQRALEQNFLNTTSTSAGAANLSLAKATWPGTASAAFSALATPGQVSSYNSSSPDQQRFLAANTLLSALSSGAVPPLGSSARMILA